MVEQFVRHCETTANLCGTKTGKWQSHLLPGTSCSEGALNLRSAIWEYGDGYVYSAGSELGAHAGSLHVELGSVDKYFAAKSFSEAPTMSVR